MEPKFNPKKIAAYWQKTAQHDYEAMQDFFRIKRYSETLFFGHIVLEKILKAKVVLYTGEHAPYTHNLVKLYGLSGFELSDVEVLFLAEMNDYNLRTRYPDYKLMIYKKCTRKYTKARIEKTTSLYNKLCEQLKQKIS